MLIKPDKEPEATQERRRTRVEELREGIQGKGRGVRGGEEGERGRVGVEVGGGVEDGETDTRGGEQGGGKTQWTPQNLTHKILIFREPICESMASCVLHSAPI